jgi:hypothetical protein
LQSGALRHCQEGFRRQAVAGNGRHSPLGSGCFCNIGRCCRSRRFWSRPGCDRRRGCFSDWCRKCRCRLKVCDLTRCDGRCCRLISSRARCLLTTRRAVAPVATVAVTGATFTRFPRGLNVFGNTFGGGCSIGHFSGHCRCNVGAWGLSFVLARAPFVAPTTATAVTPFAGLTSLWGHSLASWCGCIDQRLGRDGFCGAVIAAGRLFGPFALA